MVSFIDSRTTRVFLTLLLFASELKSLVTAAGRELTVDPSALVASTLFYFLPEERCAIQGVSKLPDSQNP